MGTSKLERNEIPFSEFNRNLENNDFFNLTPDERKKLIDDLENFFKLDNNDSSRS